MWSTTQSSSRSTTKPSSTSAFQMLRRSRTSSSAAHAAPSCLRLRFAPIAPSCQARAKPRLDRAVKSLGSLAPSTAGSPAGTRDDAMYQWTDEQEMVRGAVRQFIDKEIRPRIEEFEHGDTPPYDVLRKMFREFGMDV